MEVHFSGPPSAVSLISAKLWHVLKVKHLLEQVE